MGQFITAGTALLTDIRAVPDIDALVKPSATTEEAPVRTTTQHVASIALDHIDFGYGAHAHPERLQLPVREGRIYAIVGPSGSGKSTLADLLLGLVHPDRGSVAVNGGSLELASVRNRLMLVEQLPKIFSTTLRENLLFGTEASDERLWKALELVDLADSVRHMRDGLDTKLSYQGENSRAASASASASPARWCVIRTCWCSTKPPAHSTRARARWCSENVSRHMRHGVLIMITHDPHLVEWADEVLDFATISGKTPVTAAPAASS